MDVFFTTDTLDGLFVHQNRFWELLSVNLREVAHVLFCKFCVAMSVCNSGQGMQVHVDTSVGSLEKFNIVSSKYKSVEQETKVRLAFDSLRH